MKQGRTLDQLAAEVIRQNELKRDYILDTRALSAVVNPDSKQLQVQVRDQATLTPSRHFLSQVGTWNGIPAKYVERMEKEAPALLATNLNHWFNATPASRMVRSLDTTARAFLSNRYRRLDNVDMLGAVLPELQAFGQPLTFASCEITESRLYLKVIAQEIQTEVRKGDIVRAGFMIQNSEIGMSTWKVLPFAERLVCLNGMVINDSKLQQYHIGRAQDESDEHYADDTRRVIDASLMLRLRDTVRALLSPEKFSQLVQPMRDAANRELEAGADVVGAVTVLQDKIGLNESEKSAALRHLIASGDLSQWGFANAVTRAAADVDDYDRATELEGLGHNVITLPPSDWREIATAAAIAA